MTAWRRIGIVTIWAIRSNSGLILSEFAAGSPQDVGRKLLPAHYDEFRLQVSSSYRELFDRAVQSVLDREGWKIVRVIRVGQPAVL
jgi:hypothetical protein